jgi:hypothetical protein
LFSFITQLIRLSYENPNTCTEFLSEAMAFLRKQNSWMHKPFSEVSPLEFEFEWEMDFRVFGCGGVPLEARQVAKWSVS